MLICYDHQLTAIISYYLFTQQGAATPFNNIQLFTYFICPVNIHIQVLCFSKSSKRNPQLTGQLGRCFGSSNGPDLQSLLYHGSYFLYGPVCGRSGAETYHHSRTDQLRSLLSCS